MKNKRLLTLSFGICIALVLVALPLLGSCAKPAPPAPAPAPAPAPVKPIVLSFSTEEPDTAFRSINIYKPWFDEIEKATGGRVKIQPYWGGSLVAVPDMYDAVVKGTVDIALTITPFQTVAKFVMDDVMYLSDYDVRCWKPARVFWELYQKFPQLQAEYADTKVLFLTSLVGSGLGTTKKPIRKLEDIKGLKMIAAGKISTAKGEALGFIPVQVPPTGYEEMQKGIVDGQAMCEPDNLYSFKFGELVRYFNPITFVQGAFFCTMNLNKWNSLPPDIQKIMNDLSGNHIVDNCDTQNGSKYKYCLTQAPKDFNLEVINLPPEELARWVQTERPVQDAFAADLEAKGLPGKNLVAEYLRLNKKYAAAEYEPK